MSAPVTLHNEILSYNFTNKINAWREWSWAGSEPLNKRIMSFIALVTLKNAYNVSYEGTIPFSMIHRIG